MDRPDLQYFAYAMQYEGAAELVGGSAGSGGGTSNSILSATSNSIPSNGGASNATCFNVCSNSTNSPAEFNGMCPQLQLPILALYPEQIRGFGGA